MRKYTGAQVELQIALLLIGFTGLFGKLITASPVVIAFGRTAVAAIAICIGLQLLRGSGRGTVLSIPALFPWVALSGVLLTLHWLTFFHAIQISTVAIGLIGFAAFPVFVTLIEPIIHRLALRLVDCFSAGLVVAGLLLVAPSSELSSATAQGLLWALLSGFIYALLTLLNQKLARTQSAIYLTFWQQACVALFLLPPMVIGELWPDMTTWTWLLILGSVCTVLPQILLIRALKFVRAQMVAIAIALEPVYGIVFAALFLGEIPELRTLAGGTVILAAVLLAIRAHRPAIASVAP
jgi:drug/metabolite transporter (DMT)-like permease